MSVRGAWIPWVQRWLTQSLGSSLQSPSNMMLLELLMIILATSPSTDNSTSQKESAFCVQNDIHRKTTSTEVPQESLKAGSNSKTICQNGCSVCRCLQRENRRGSQVASPQALVTYFIIFPSTVVKHEKQFSQTLNNSIWFNVQDLF